MTSLTYTAEDAMRHCRDVTRRRARNFYYGLKLLPEPARSRLFAVYAWMRRADDVADDAGDDVDAARARLADLRIATGAALAGEEIDGADPVLVGLRTVAADVRLDPDLFGSMIDGQLDDLAGREYATFEDLREYCYRVASTVGLVCIEIWGYADPVARRLAVDRGIAFQLTNILRDLREDHAAGRCYVPAEDLAAHGLAPDDVVAGARPRETERLLRAQVERAESFYARSAGLDGMIAPACRPTLWAMTTIYHRLLDRIERDPMAVVRRPRVRLSSLEKSAIAVRARWRARTAGHGAR